MDTLPWKKKQRERGRTRHALIGMDSKINPESGKIHGDGYVTHHAGAGCYNLSHNTRHSISQSRLHWGRRSPVMLNRSLAGCPERRSLKGSRFKELVRGVRLFFVFLLLFVLKSDWYDGELGVFVVVLPRVENHWGVSESDTSGDVSHHDEVPQLWSTGNPPQVAQQTQTHFGLQLLCSCLKVAQFWLIDTWQER